MIVILICISQMTFHVLFHVLICHKHILFDGMSLYIFWSFSYQIVLFFLLLLLELFIHSIYYSFVVYLVCRYFLLLCNLSLMPFFWSFLPLEKFLTKQINISFFFIDCAFVVKSRKDLHSLTSQRISLMVLFLKFLLFYVLH